VKKGDKYQKAAYEAGKPARSKPVHRSPAEKMQ
jgi:hypothetical protein